MFAYPSKTPTPLSYAAMLLGNKNLNLKFPTTVNNRLTQLNYKMSMLKSKGEGQNEVIFKLVWDLPDRSSLLMPLCIFMHLIVRTRFLSMHERLCFINYKWGFWIYMRFLLCLLVSGRTKSFFVDPLVENFWIFKRIQSIGIFPNCPAAPVHVAIAFTTTNALNFEI